MVHPAVQLCDLLIWRASVLCRAARSVSFVLLITMLMSSSYWWISVQSLMDSSWPCTAVTFVWTWTERSFMFEACQNSRIEETVTDQSPALLGSLSLLRYDAPQTYSIRICVYPNVFDVGHRQFHTLIRLLAQQTWYFESLRCHTTVQVVRWIPYYLPIGMIVGSIYFPTYSSHFKQLFGTVEWSYIIYIPSKCQFFLLFTLARSILHVLV